jgi:hypothetical protein
MKESVSSYQTRRGHSHIKLLFKQTPWSESESELYRLSDRRLSAKLVPSFADRGCYVVSVTDPYGRILGFLDRKIIVYMAEISKRNLLGVTRRPEFEADNLTAICEPIV